MPDLLRGTRRKQIIFNAVALLAAALLLCCICVQYFLLLPSTPLAQQHILLGAIRIEAVPVALLVVGAIANLVYRRLVIWSTFLIMAGYVITIWFLPLAFWGWFALREELDRTAR